MRLAQAGLHYVQPMRTFIAAVFAAVMLTACTGGKTEGTNLILPNPKLVGCGSPDCQQLWRDAAATPVATFPKQLSLDFKGRYTYGVTAKYDKVTPIRNIKSAVDKQYGKWAVSGFTEPPLMMWRVEEEGLAIQLGVTDDGMPQLIYLSLRPELR